MKRFTLLLMLFYLAPYAVAQEVPMYETITENIPDIGETAEVYLGETMLKQRSGDYRECIIPKTEWWKTAVGGDPPWLPKVNQPLCRNEATDYPSYVPYLPTYKVFLDYFYSYGANFTDSKWEEGYDLLLVIFYKGNGSVLTNDIFRVRGLGRGDLLINNMYFLHQPESVEKTIDYIGKTDNQLKFVYSEIDHRANNSFSLSSYLFGRKDLTKEIQVDLNEGNVIAFEGALIEIEEATNEKIRYKVVRNFQD